MKSALVIVLSLAATASATAATKLLDFEMADELALLPYHTRGKTALQPVPEFATHGRTALRFSAPAWKRGLPEWPSFEMKSPVRDWSPYSARWALSSGHCRGGANAW